MRGYLVASALAAITLLGIIVMEGARRAEAPAPLSLESAILPPAAFREWWIGQGKKMGKRGRGEYPMDPDAKGRDDRIPSDRFADGGSWQNPTKMPGYLEADQNQARAKYEPEVLKLRQEISGIQLDLEDPKKASTWAKLKAQEKLAETKLQKILYQWFSTPVQKDVSKLNKDLVVGRARGWNEDKFLGGSDHFVTLDQAKKQLDGAGYGHRYSITDWLVGD